MHCSALRSKTSQNNLSNVLTSISSPQYNTHSPSSTADKQQIKSSHGRGLRRIFEKVKVVSVTDRVLPRRSIVR